MSFIDQSYKWLRPDPSSDRLDFTVVDDPSLSATNRHQIDAELVRLVMSIQAQQQQRNADWDDYRTQQRDPDDYRAERADLADWKARAGTLKTLAVQAKQRNKQLLIEMRPTPPPVGLDGFSSVRTGTEDGKSISVEVDGGDVIVTIDYGGKSWYVPLNRRTAELLGMDLIRATAMGRDTDD